MKEIRCGVCGSTIKLGNDNDSSIPFTELKYGIHYLVPETIRNENIGDWNSQY